MKPVARHWLRIEGLAVALGAFALLWHTDTGLPMWLIIVLLLAPDLAIAGYLAGNRVGAITYNLAHSYAGPMIMTAVWAIWGAPDPVFACLWALHIGADRALGYGLKGASFYETHLGMIGRA